MSSSAHSPRANFRTSSYDSFRSYSQSHVVPPRRLPEFPVPEELIPIVLNDLKPTAHMTEGSSLKLRILESIKSGMFQTNESNHIQVLDLLLYVEEIVSDVDMGRDVKCSPCTIERCQGDKISFKIFVNQLKKMIPAIKPEDQIRLTDIDLNFHSLQVTHVFDEYFVAVADERFCQQYSSDKKYNVNCGFGNYTFRCCHYSLDLIGQFRLTPLLFPVKGGICPEIKYPNEWFNTSVRDDPQQKHAVLQIASKSSFPVPYILYGPPGTGKTATVVEAICQARRSNPANIILVCTPSNPASDVIARRLLEYIPKSDIYRIYSLSKEGSSIDEATVGCSNFMDGRGALNSETLRQKKILVCTLCVATRLILMGFRGTYFSHIFIDEAGQATEPDTLIPFSLSSSCETGSVGRLHAQIIISGDPQELGPVIKSKIAEPLLGKSMLERLTNCEPYKKNIYGVYDPRYITKLIRNYRSHPLLIKVPNELFYDQELKTYGHNEVIRKAENWQHLVAKKFPIVFHAVEGIEKKDERSPSVYNDEEIEVVVHYVQLLLKSKFKNHTISQQDIGIITPFSEQSRKLQTALKNKHFGNVEVGTVELFQGREKDIIILSTVRSKNFFHDNKMHIGSLSNQKRFNVALTRAKALLIMVGNPKALQTDKNWLHFLKFCHENNACCGSKFEISKEGKVISKKKSREGQRCESIDVFSDAFELFRYGWSGCLLVLKVLKVLRKSLSALFNP